jgi:hypothetical protein
MDDLLYHYIFITGQCVALIEALKYSIAVF